MSAFWDNNDANGKPLTDGRLCYVIKSDSDPTMPAIRIYGKDREEILDKAAKTVETAQIQIHRMRKQPAPIQARPAIAPVTEEQIQTAVVDLQNPAKVGPALRTLLKSQGVDLDRQALDAALRRVAVVAEQWEQAHPEFPKDANDPNQRNERTLMDRATTLAGATHKVTSEHLDVAFAELLREQRFFEPTVHPRGSEAPRTVVATTHRRTSFSGSEPAPARRESDTEKEWRRIASSGSTRELRQAIETQPGFKKWMDEKYAASA